MKSRSGTGGRRVRSSGESLMQQRHGRGGSQREQGKCSRQRGVRVGTAELILETKGACQ